MRVFGAPHRARQLWAFALLVPLAAGAQSLPTAAEVTSRIGVGWNLGNTLEVPLSSGGETGWGNPKATQQLIDGVKAAGFNAVRLPCAWDGYANAATHQIDAAWLARVKEVVDYCIRDGLYVVLNIHWDGGWLENHPLSADQAAVNAKQRAYWTQIATAFKDYDEHLLFAGTNEVNVNWAAPTSENITAQQSYLQTFVDAVRATGGNNATRTLAVQTYSTNIGYGLDRFTLPRDTATGRLLVEVHFYDPYDYTANETGSCLYWGAPYPAQGACSWAQESWLDDRFAKVKARWVDQGVPVIVGEYGVSRRLNLAGQQLTDHLASRRYYLEYLNAAARKSGVKTFYWDNGVTTKHAPALFDRDGGAVIDRGGIDAILKGAGLTSPPVRYTLTTTADGAGTVTRTPDAASYAGGTSVTLTAAPTAGHEFAGWTGGLVGATSPATIVLDRDTAVVAHFSASQGGSSGGSTSSSGGGSTGSSGGGSTGSSGGGSTGSSGGGSTGSSGGATTTFALEVSRAGTGGGRVTSTPTGLSCGAACTVAFATGTNVSLTATATEGSTFAGWNGACAGAGACTVSMTELRRVTATFDAASGDDERYTLPATGCASGGGGGALLLIPAVLRLLARRRGPRRTRPHPCGPGERPAPRAATGAARLTGLT